MYTIAPEELPPLLYRLPPRFAYIKQSDRPKQAQESAHLAMAVDECTEILVAIKIAAVVTTAVRRIIAAIIIFTAACL